MLGFVSVSLFAFLAAISAWRRATPGPARERASAFALAFGVRDCLFTLGVLANMAYDLVPGMLHEATEFTSILLSTSSTLNKVGEKIANTAMPQVQPTPVYVQFKKLEVYRAAIEAAHETGGIGARERASLDRLRAKLGLDPTDCAAVEAEVAGAGDAPPSGATPTP